MLQLLTNSQSTNHYLMPVIKILGMGDAKTKLLREHVAGALALYPVRSKVIDVSEPNQILQTGISTTPALMLDGKVVAEGDVPTVDDITRMLKRRYLYRSKLYRCRRILAPLDYSVAADNAFRYACRLAQVLGASVEALHVSPTFYNGPKQPGISDLYDQEQQTLRLHVEGLTPSPAELPKGARRPKVTSSLRFGLPEVEVVEASEKADLIVMGAVGQSGWLRQLLGGVSAEVSREAHCPVLFVPPHARFQGVKNILYAANYASLDAEKIRQLVSFADRFGAQIHFVHIAGDLSDTLEQRLFAINYEQAEGRRPFRFQRVDSDDVISALNDYAVRHEIDLSVFVTERRDLWPALLHQSTTRRMLPRTHVPMLVVHLNNDSVY